MSWVSFLSGSVDDIIDHYKKEQIVEGYNLKEAVSVQVSSYMLTSYSEPHCIFDLAKCVCVCLWRYQGLAFVPPWKGSVQIFFWDVILLIFEVKF